MLSTLALSLFVLSAWAGHLRNPDTHRRAVLAARNATESKRQYPSFYQVDWFQGDGFFDNFSFFTGQDPTQGTVNYLDAPTAWSAGLVSTTSSTATISVDSTSWLGPGEARNSVRIQSLNSYNGGLLVLDLNAMPYGCSLWPAFWTVGPNWPLDGEIDIIESVNGAQNNQMTLHTGPGCTQSAAGPISGYVVGTDCDAYDASNAGCGIVDPDPSATGAGLADAGGGVFAMLWDGSGVRVWHFSRGNVPGDIGAGQPAPGGWGQPAAQWSAGTCDPDQYLRAQSIVFDTTICGDWAGAVYGDSGCPGTCEQQVMDPGNFQTAYWDINYVAIYAES